MLKVRKNRITLRKVTQPSQCVLVDQMESRIVEFCGILRECLTKRRYSCAMLFIDHYNRLIYVYLQHSLTIEDTIIAKKAFDAYFRNHDCIIMQTAEDS